MLQNGKDLEKNLEKKTTLKKIRRYIKKGHNRDLNPEHHTHVPQCLKTLRYLMADPMSLFKR